MKGVYVIVRNAGHRQTNTKFFGQCCESARHYRRYIKRTSSLYTEGTNDS